MFLYVLGVQTPAIVDVGGVADFSAAVGRAGRLVPRPSCRLLMRGRPNIGTLREHAKNSVQCTRIACVDSQLAGYRSLYDARSCAYCVHNMPALQS